MTETFRTFHQLKQKRVNQHLKQVLTLDDPSANLAKAMNYAVLNGGKRLRPVLVYAAYNAIKPHTNSKNNFDAVDDIAAAIELIHSYSLVHDDLPAMDDDDLRRGKPTCHKAFDDATAILAGDGLQSFAFELICNSTSIDDKQKVQLCQSLAHAAGPLGMVAGQMVDLEAVNKPISQSQLEAMHKLKTGALICCALDLGAICANANQQQRKILQNYGECIGLAFQVVDDILDVTGETATLGKQQGADQERGKPTYPALMGLEQAKTYAITLCDDAKKALTDLGQPNPVLEGLAEYIVNREF